MGNARSAFGYPQNVLRRFSADTPHRTVHAVFPHTALRVGLVSSVSLPFAPRLRFTLIPMDAPPYGRAVSDAPPHSGLSPIAVFRHYYSRHLICIVPFFTQRPFASTGITPLPRYYGLVRLLASLSLQRGLPSSLAELSGHAILLCPARALARRFAIAFGDLPSASLRRISFRPPKSIR